VPVNNVSKLVADALSAALSFGDKVVAVSVVSDREQSEELEADWARWHPGIELVVLRSKSRSVADPIVSYVCSAEVRAQGRVVVVIPEIEPEKWRHEVLHNQRGLLLANRLRRKSDVVVARLPLRLREGSTEG
jgi:hypothetical protein